MEYIFNMFDSTNDFILQINLLDDLTPEMKKVMVDLLVFEKQIEDKGESYAYKARMHEIIDQHIKQVTDAN